MNWPWSRRGPVEIVVTHKVALSKKTLRAIDRLAAAQRYAARVAAGGVVFTRPSEVPDEIAAWAAGHPDVEKIEREDIVQWFRIIRGDVKVDPETRRMAILEYGARQEQYGLPEIPAA